MRSGVVVAWVLLVASGAGWLGVAGVADPVASAQAPGDPDPLALGHFAVATSGYHLGWMLVSDPAAAVGGVDLLTYPVEVQGEAHYPAEALDGGPPRFPLVLLMHGRHGTCALFGSEILGTHVCPPLDPVLDPVESFTGYRGLAEVLASHGYVVASVNANQINDRDAFGDAGAEARGQLTLETLARFLGLASGVPEPVAALAQDDPNVAALRPSLDPERIGLMGHSRGGMGVARAHVLNQEAPEAERLGLRTVFALAPTDFHGENVRGVAFGTLLPYCDGDVTTLHGSWMYDDARYGTPPPGGDAPLHQFLHLGANHNFYNTVWFQDDASRWSGEPGPCGQSPGANGRPSHADQRAAGYGVMAAFLRAYTGGEAAFLPLLKGAAALPASMCPSGVAPCPGEVGVSYHPPASDRLVLEGAQTGTSVTVTDLGTPSVVTGASAVERCIPDACDGDWDIGRAARVDLDWDGTVRWSLAVPSANEDVRGFDALTLRVATPVLDPGPQPGRATLTAHLVDAQGTSAAVVRGADEPWLDLPTGDDVAKSVLTMLRLPLDDFAAQGVDLGQVREVRVELTAVQGDLHVTDVMFQR